VSGRSPYFLVVRRPVGHRRPNIGRTTFGNPAGKNVVWNGFLHPPEVSKYNVLAITSLGKYPTDRRSLQYAEQKPTGTNLVSCSQTTMSTESDPLLATPTQFRANAQNLEEFRKDEKLGPLEISRSNRWAILAGIWTANFLGVRRAVSC